MSLRSNTKRSYASHQRTYFRFCNTISHDPLKPITPDQLCMCISDYVSTHKVTTLPAYLSALSEFYRSNSLGELLREHERVIRVRKVLLIIIHYPKQQHQNYHLVLQN